MSANSLGSSPLVGDPWQVRPRPLFTALLATALSLGALPAHADPSPVEVARKAYNAAVAQAAKVQKEAITRANREYQQALRNAPNGVAMANAQAKALADQATKASAAKAAFDQALAAAGNDRQAQAKAAREYDAAVRAIQLETERALKNARGANGQNPRELAKIARDLAIQVAKDAYDRSVSEARAALNAVLAENKLRAQRK